MKAEFFTLLVFVCCIFLSCGKTKPDAPTPYENPSAEGFDLAHSDPAAVELADSVMHAMGGRKNWDQTRFISWTSADHKIITWDKELDRVRIESQNDSTIYLLDAKNMKGRFRIKGQELTVSDSVNKMLSTVKEVWLSECYWLVMPFKLKDSGVTLKYLGEDTLKTGGRCNVLELSISNANKIPQKKYNVFIDLKDNLIKQWAYFEGNADEPDFVYAWDNYKPYGNILLSANRSDGNGPTNVKVHESLDDKLFQEF